MVEAPFLERLKSYAQVQPVCPEVEIGLGIPRDPICVVEQETVRKLIQWPSGKDFTSPMKNFVESFLSSLRQVDGFVLKSRSPSCGLTDTKIYGDAEKKTLKGEGAGFFGAGVLERFSHLALADESRLENHRMREHFLTKLFILADFREVKESGEVEKLIRFHKKHRILLSVYDQFEIDNLNEQLANREVYTPREVMENYEKGLWKALSRPPHEGGLVDMLREIWEGMAGSIPQEEKLCFDELLDRFRVGEAPLWEPRWMVKAWITTLGRGHLLDQSFFSPYPEELNG